MTVYRRPDPIPLRRAGNHDAGHTLLTPVRAEADDLNRLVARQIFGAVLGGRFPAGSILPNEHQLATDLGVSRTALREAIKGLVAKGVLETRRKRGTQVLDRSLWNMLDPDLIGWSRRDGSRRVSEELWETLAVTLGPLEGVGLSIELHAATTERRREAFAEAVMDLARARHNRFVLSVTAACLRSLLRDDPAFLDARIGALSTRDGALLTEKPR